MNKVEDKPKALPQFFHCGCCDAYHRIEFTGDCRDDSARLDPDDLDKQYGITGWEEIDPWPDPVSPLDLIEKP